VNFAGIKAYPAPDPIKHNCRTQHRTEQLWLSPLFSFRQTSELRCGLWQGTDVIRKRHHVYKVGWAIIVVAFSCQYRRLPQMVETPLQLTTHRMKQQITRTETCRLYKDSLQSTYNNASILKRKCTMTASRAAPWWVTLSMRPINVRKKMRQTDGRTDAIPLHYAFRYRCDQRIIAITMRTM